MKSPQNINNNIQHNILNLNQPPRPIILHPNHINNSTKQININIDNSINKQNHHQNINNNINFNVINNNHN